ncbi:transmembrane protein 60 [Galendromus occidentalis]|uniref:Transmembrane protein 60 n=1 Tax=Galendromus occidentalis TaxID=34638 RepID=A0AAJ6QNU7_9ACAR|nr:transmembrane protein 60 [Galendromus occidentalis]
MTTLQMSLVIWSLCATFIAMLAFRLDEKHHWNWFGVFIPMFILDLKLLAIAGYEVYTGFRRQLEPTCPRESLFVLGVISKTTFQILLCLRLEYLANLPWTVVLAPFWIAIIFFQANILVPLNYFCDGSAE